MRRRVAVIQARCSSSRLPGKVLQPLLGQPLITFMIDRVRLARRVDDIVLATSTDPSDDALADAARAHGVQVHRGPLDDVLARFVGAAKDSGATHIVRLTGDCPLIDADLIDSVIGLLDGQADYASNCDPPMWPDGLDVEAMSVQALLAAHEEARLPSQREHVTPFIRGNPERFRPARLTSLVNLSSLRWTVDYPDDLQFVRELLASAQVASSTSFDRFDLLRAIERQPGLVLINHHQRNEGLTLSLKKDPLE